MHATNGYKSATKIQPMIPAFCAVANVGARRGREQGVVEIAFKVMGVSGFSRICVVIE